MSQFSSRNQRFHSLFPNEKPFRLKQMEQGLFNRVFTQWEDMIFLPQSIRERLQKEIPWMSLREEKMFASRDTHTFKVLLTLADGHHIESVLMENKKGSWTICVSSQVGCAMNCAFCATGKMGFIRDLISDEIVDQYRFWIQFLQSRPELPQRINNIVFMGMGEPLANYENVKTAINTWLAYTDIGPTYITVSTVGVIPRLENILKDTEWPHVRFAISLHSADAATRKIIVPTSYDAFLDDLADWAKRYLRTQGNRRHYLTFEYVMLKNVNDSEHHARTLASFMKSLGHVKVNLIPYNYTHSVFKKSLDSSMQNFLLLLQKEGVNATRRQSMGDDIAAACGQLITSKSPPKCHVE